MKSFVFINITQTLQPQSITFMYITIPIGQCWHIFVNCRSDLRLEWKEYVCSKRPPFSYRSSVWWKNWGPLTPCEHYVRQIVQRNCLGIDCTNLCFMSMFLILIDTINVRNLRPFQPSNVLSLFDPRNTFIQTQHKFLLIIYRETSRIFTSNKLCSQNYKY